MRTTTILIALTMLTTGLAGCTGDPDGGGNDEFDAETLQGMIESGLQDFMNNTTVEITTNYYTNETSTTTNYVNGSGVSSIIHVLAGVDEGEASLSMNVDTNNHLALLVREDAFTAAGAGYSADGLDGANICVGIGTWIEGELVDYFSSKNIAFTSVPVSDNSEAVTKFIDGSCDAMSGSIVALQGLQEALYGDGSMNGVDMWITNSVGTIGNETDDYTWLAGWSFLNLTISQASGEGSFLSYAYAEITLSGTCVSNCTIQDEYVSQTITFTLEDDSILGIIFEQEPGITTSSSCEHGYSEADWPGAFGPYGLECDLTLSVMAQFDLTSQWWPYQISNLEDYEFSWGDWTYYVLWESTPVTMHE